MAEPLIKVQMLGLREFRQNLRAADAALPREVRKVFNEVSKAIRDDASARMPRRSGKLAASVRARSTQTEGRVVAGKGSVPYAGFIEFGGRVGKGRTGPGTGSVSRPYIRSGRYLYPALVRRQDEVKQAMEQALANLAQRLSR